jgi:hypothetical protein
MKIQTIAAVAALGVALSGCATIVDGTTQAMSVTTTPVQGAACTLTNSEGTWYLTSPASVQVHKTKNDLNISCTKDGFQAGSVVAPAVFGGMTAGNLLAGGIIGAGIDAASGANYYYNSPVTVPLGDLKAAPQAPAAPQTKPAV